MSRKTLLEKRHRPTLPLIESPSPAKLTFSKANKSNDVTDITTNSPKEDRIEIKTTVKLEGIVKHSVEEDDPKIIIENVTKAIASIDETVKRTGIFSKAARRRKNDLMRQLQQLQLSLVPTIDIKPCTKPMLVQAKKGEITISFQYPKVEASLKISGYEVQYCTGRSLIQLAFETERQKRNRKRGDLKLDARRESDNAYLKKQLVWRTGKIIGFARGDRKRQIHYTLTNLPPGDAVMVKVRARYDGKGYSPWSKTSDMFQAVTGKEPSPCERPVAKSRTFSELVITWPATSPMGITGYYVEKARSMGLHPKDVEESDSEEVSVRAIDDIVEPYSLDDLQWGPATNNLVSENIVALKNLKNGIGYRFRVRAQNTEGLWSKPGKISMEFNLLPLPPVAPLEPIKQEATENSITIRWNEPELNGSARIESYEIKLATNKMGWEAYNNRIVSQYGHFTETITPAIVDSLAGTTPSSPEHNKGFDDRPGTTETMYSLASTTAPSEGMIADIEDGLYWQTVHVNVRAKAALFGHGSKIKYCFYAIGNLAPDTGYKFRVRAVAAKGHSPWSKASEMFYTCQENIDIRQIVWDAKSSGPSAIVSLMREEKFLKHAALQCRAIRGLRSIAMASKDGQLRVLKANAQEEIVETMKNHESNHHVVRWGCRALTALISNETPSDPAFSQQPFSALLDKNKDTYNLTMDSVNEVVSAMVRMKSNSAIQQWACEFVVKLCKNQTNGCLLIDKAAGVISAIITALQVYMGNVKIVEQALQALLHIVRSKEASRQLACDLNGESILKGIILRYKLNPAVQQYGGECLSALKPPLKARTLVSREKIEDSTARKEIIPLSRENEKKKSRPDSAKTFISVATSSKWSGSTEISLASIGSLLADRLLPEELEFFQRIEFQLMCQAIDMAVEYPPPDFVIGRADPESVAADRLSLAVKSARTERSSSDKPLLGDQVDSTQPSQNDHPYFHDFDDDEAELLLRLEEHLRMSDKTRSSKHERSGEANTDDGASSVAEEDDSEGPKKINSVEFQNTGEGELKFGDIIDMDGEEQLKVFLNSYKGFSQYADLLKRDGFDDMESMIHVEKEDLTDLLPPYVAERIYKVVQREKMNWKKIYNIQRERKQLERDEELRQQREEEEEYGDAFSYDDEEYGDAFSYDYEGDED